MRRRSTGSRSRLDPMEAARKDAWRYLRVRERTRAEMRSYLRRRGHGESIVRDLTQDLVAAGLLDDRRFAVIYLMDRMRLRPVGSRRARAELRAKGVSEEIIAEAFAQLEPPWDDMELARVALSGRWNRWPESRRLRLATAFLRRRGFDGETIWRVLSELMDHD